MTDQIKPKIAGSKLLFQNPLLERLTRTHIAVPLTIFFVYAAGLLIWSATATTLTTWTTVAMFFLGLVAWTWMEYALHRFIFHTAQGSKFQYTIHGVHHEFPKDKNRLAMPPVVSVSIATGLLFIFKLALAEYSFACLAGFVTGYAMYLCVHYMIHAFHPPKNFLKTLWTNHSMHHYKDGKQLFGVSSPLWDYVFGTMPKRQIRSEI
jgi:sterol desaturase/sphingolipid hydroxylase (fatty acid hydroxylase superfamily)